MGIILHLLNAHNNAHELTNTIMKASIKAYEDFLPKEDDRPVIESYNDEDNSLQYYLDKLKQTYSSFHRTLERPRKVLESEDITAGNAERIKLIGDMKDVVKVQNHNNPTTASKQMKIRLDIVKNLRTEEMSKVTGYIEKLIHDLNTIQYATMVKELKLETLLAKLTEVENNFEEKYSKRNIIVTNRKNDKTKDAKIECVNAYQELIENTNAAVLRDRTTDYNTLVETLNAIIDPINVEIRSRRKKNDDRPIIKFAKKKKMKKVTTEDKPASEDMP